MVLFDPHDEYFKSPFGAVTLGTAVHFRAKAMEGFSRCLLSVYRDFAAQREELDMSPSADFFEIEYIVPETAELIWYTFIYMRENGERTYLGADGMSQNPDCPAFQLTVYDGSRPDPDWFGRGITYQIFPDRFCRTNIPDPNGMVGNRTVHQNWEDCPVYLPENGEITNRDFFGGSLEGIISKLDYLKSLYVSTIYLNPIFEAASNHRYDTSDYSRIDPMLGSEADFVRLCAEAKARGIRIILDGVFNHTGSNSRYFNAKGFYDTVGAAQSPDSPYSSWYRFDRWPDEYSCWWGVKTLPQVEESTPSYLDYIIRDKNSIIRRWLRLGASGWRLDVADELPDSFIAALRAAASEEKSDAAVIGEVWEDGSNKIAYDTRRRYLLGEECTGLMNYPLRTAILNFVKGGKAEDFKSAMELIREHYPPPAFYGAMNFLGTHDTPRILTLLGQSEDLSSKTRDYRAAYVLSETEMKNAKLRLRLAAILLYAFPGSPVIFYGDEAGIQGCEDPFNRRTFPWGGEDAALTALYRNLGYVRSRSNALIQGTIDYIQAENGVLIFARRFGSETCYAAVNLGNSSIDIALPWSKSLATDGATLEQFYVSDNSLHFTLAPCDGVLLV